MKKKIFLILLGLIALNLNAQNYDQLIKKADSCYTAKNYKQSIDYFKKAFKFNSNSKNSYYNAACSAALANDKKTALKWLEISIKKGYDDINHLKSDTDLDNLHQEKKWLQLTNDLQKKVDIMEANMDKPLQKELLSILKEDQDIRNLYTAVQKKHNYQNNKEGDSLGKIMILKDSLNLIKIIKILDEKGWVGKDKVGTPANLTLFLVIQHSNLEIQKKYLPMMQEAVKKGNEYPSSLALLEDRIAIREGRKQIYGSQLGTNPETKKSYFFPIEDPDNVNKRREKMGLGPIEEYAKHFDVVWDVEAYKKELPELEKLAKKK